MKILYFAWLRAKIGTGEEDLSPPAEIATVGALIAWLKTCSRGHAEAFAEGSLIRAAVNQDYAGLDHPVAAGDEVAFFPPVTGG
ncbi:MAG TPA: molybdopterin converting factor subunit 1 [Patescibacteria group bacterium]|nr:molybdopterin converting factor subunit 1 [Patescibacteria group bacterium]